MVKLSLILLLLLAGCHYRVSAKVFGQGKETIVAYYDTETEEFMLFDVKRYKEIAWAFYRQFFPDQIGNPALQQSQAFNPEEFGRMCEWSEKVKACKLSKY